MGSSGFRWFAVWAVVGLVLTIGCLSSPTDSNQGGDGSSPTPPPAAPASAPIPGAAAAQPPVKTAGSTPATALGVRGIVDDVAIKNYGKLAYRGSVDLSATIERIRSGIKHPHRNDGSVFGNRERLLPRRKRGYYREYVHPTQGINGPGPQRIVVGENGDWWYTPDHYASFISLGQETR